MPKVSGVKMPWDLYVVLNEPSLLAGMCYPYAGTAFKSLGKAGFTGIVCLSDSRVDYDPSPLRLLHATGLEDLRPGTMPIDPDREEGMIRDAVDVVVNGLGMGEGIVVHCIGGIGRTGTVIGCVLRALGLSADAAIGYLDRINVERRIGRWSATEWQAEMVRKY